MMNVLVLFVCLGFFFFQGEEGIGDLVRSGGLGDVYKRRVYEKAASLATALAAASGMLRTDDE